MKLRCRSCRADGARCVRRPHFGAHLYGWSQVPDGEFVERNVAALFPIVVQARANGRCEAAWQQRAGGGWICTPGRHVGTVAYTPRPDVLDPDVGVWLCPTAFDHFARNPADLRSAFPGLYGPDVA